MFFNNKTPIKTEPAYRSETQKKAVERAEGLRAQGHKWDYVMQALEFEGYTNEKGKPFHQANISSLLRQKQGRPPRMGKKKREALEMQARTVTAQEAIRRNKELGKMPVTPRPIQTEFRPTVRTSPTDRIDVELAYKAVGMLVLAGVSTQALAPVINEIS